MSATYLTTEQLSERIHYDARTIRNRLKDSVLLEGVHYIRPFGGRKLLFLWEAIERAAMRIADTPCTCAAGTLDRRAALAPFP